MKLFFTFLLMIAVVSLAYCFSSGSQHCDYEKIAGKITEKTARKLKEQKGLSLVGTGGQMMNDIQMMMMGFNFYSVVDIEIARQLLIDSVKEYLCDINSNDQIRQYLHNYPFKEENLEIVIYFYNAKGSNVPSGKINIAAANKGKVIYYTDHPEKHTIKSIHEETYAEAMQLINAQK